MSDELFPRRLLSVPRERPLGVGLHGKNQDQNGTVDEVEHQYEDPEKDDLCDHSATLAPESNRNRSKKFSMNNRLGRGSGMGDLYQGQRSKQLREFIQCRSRKAPTMPKAMMPNKTGRPAMKPVEDSSGVP